MVVYLLLLVLGLVLLIQGCLLFNLLRVQRELEQKVAYMFRRKQPSTSNKPPRTGNKPKNL